MRQVVDPTSRGLGHKTWRVKRQNTKKKKKNGRLCSVGTPSPGNRPTAFFFSSFFLFDGLYATLWVIRKANGLTLCLFFLFFFVYVQGKLISGSEML